jgi:glycosyltransferase involved in cell wall biosynthesis
MTIYHPTQGYACQSDNKSMGRHGLTFVVAVNDDKILQRNLLSSPLFASNDKYQVIERQGYPSAAIAYNDAIEKAKSDIIVFVHQDVYFPDNWLDELARTLKYLEDTNPSWGVLGCFGSSKDRPGGVGRVYTTGLGLHGNHIHKPEVIETVDEIVIVIRKSSGLRFDPFLPHFHLYGTDICMSAREKGMACYAIPTFCIHNANINMNLPKEFFECYHHIKKRWKQFLPIYTSCIIISRFNTDVNIRKIESVYRRLSGKVATAQYRVEDPKTLLDNL